MTGVDDAVEAIADGQLVIYPTETVYGLGGDALNPGAVERVFNAKDRPRSNPIALAVPSIEAAFEYVEADSQTVSFMREFLPGPVTVIVPKKGLVPNALTGGHETVGVRVPDCKLAQELLEQTPPLTATSANVSGREPVRTVMALDPTIKRSTTVILDGGETPGGSSTVVDVSAGRIHRHGRQAAAVEKWLSDHGINPA